MPSEKVVSALSSLGVEVPSGEFGHYGVKGMKWNKNKLPDPASPEEAAADAYMAENFPNASNTEKLRYRELMVAAKKNENLPPAEQRRIQNQIDKKYAKALLKERVAKTLKTQAKAPKSIAKP